MLEFWLDRRGAIAPLAAIVLAVVLGFAALSLDMGHNYFVQNRLQAAADASSLAGVSQLPDEVAMVTKAQEYAEKNMPSAGYGTVLANTDVVAGNWDPATRTFTPALEPLNAVQTTTRQQAASGNAAPVFLGQIFGYTGYNLGAAAIATVGIGPDVFPTGCITALNTTDPEAFYIFGTAEVSAVGCDIQINSDDPCALHAHGTPTVTVVEADGSGGIYVAGGYCTEGPVSLSPAPETGQEPIDDPYENNDPYPDDFTDADCDFTNATFNDSATIQPGVYCGGITWTGSGTATLESGDYIIREGSLNIGANVALDGGAGVGFY
ncbi:MAG: TadG family pilus assembly protein, partial [Kiloniellales bacterium]